MKFLSVLLITLLIAVTAQAQVPMTSAAVSPPDTTVQVKILVADAGVQTSLATIDRTPLIMNPYVSLSPAEVRFNTKKPLLAYWQLGPTIYMPNPNTVEVGFNLKCWKWFTVGMAWKQHTKPVMTFGATEAVNTIWAFVGAAVKTTGI
jgi:hypothetical protein